MTDIIGKSLGRYHILEQLGEGGMATVYKAYDTRLESDVAVKVIRTENLAPSILERALIRFEREAKSLAKLTHANIVKVLDYGEFDGKPYLVMPYLPGGTLKQRLHGIPMSYQEAAFILAPIARALSYAHQQGLVHRDVKPSNIMITFSGDPMLTDFGIAKIIDEEATLDLTGTSAAVGTPEYMAPEQVVSKTVDHRADIYSLGIVFYEMVTGRRPFVADTPMAVLFKHASEPLPRPKNFVPNLPDAVEYILVKALAKKAQDRYQNMSEFAAALERLAHGDVSVAAKAGQKDSSQQVTMADETRTTAQTSDINSMLTQKVSQDFGQVSQSQPPPWKRILAIGMSGVGVLVVGICVVVLAVILLNGNDTPATPKPTPFVQQPAPTTRVQEAYPTARPVDVYPTSVPPEAPQSTSTSIPSCPGAKYPTRIQADREARVCTKTDRLIVRRSPSMTASEIMSIYPGTYVRVLEGPVCADNFWWWQIEIYAGTTYSLQEYSYNQYSTTNKAYNGWVREGWDNKDSYFICQ